MATSASTAITIDEVRSKRIPGWIAHRLVLIAVAGGAMVTTVATARLAAVTLATPTEVWSKEYPVLVDATLKVADGTQRWAQGLSSRIADAGLIRAALPICSATASTKEAPSEGSADHHIACLALIDEALRAAPSSGELWFFKASELAAEGDFGEVMINALRNSYRTAPAEGWIASRRVVVGLRLFPFLPPDLQAGVTSDVQLVLRFSTLSGPLIDAYTAEELLRANAAVPLRALSHVEMEKFVWLVQEGLRGR